MAEEEQPPVRRSTLDRARRLTGRGGVARAALAVVAVLMIVWTAILFRGVEEGGDAIRAHDVEGIKSAHLLDPSRYWDRVLAVEYLSSGDTRRAAAEAEAIVREEPRNFAAWGVLYTATLQTDPRRAAEAAAAIRRLNPLGAERAGLR